MASDAELKEVKEESRVLTEVTEENNNSSDVAEREAFSHWLGPPAWYEWLWLVPAALILVPLRILGLTIIAFITSCLACLGAKRGGEDGWPAPHRGWRGSFASGVWAMTGYPVFWAMGFRVRVVGKQAAREDAPVLIVAPHSSFLDVFVVSICRGSPVARIENSRTCILGHIQDVCQTIYVDRKSLESRERALKNIIDRARSCLSWSQLLIFPEGTTTNSKQLVRFQTGGFRPGTPVQPVTIKYGRPDLTTGTRDQSHTMVTSLLRILTRPFNEVTLEFLPVYSPTEEEVRDSVKFAKNVQRVMAENLGVSATDIQRREFRRKQSPPAWSA